ncbi:hypothetical protein ACN22W_02270 [Burkholderia theae]|uniref:hypothetical protein n=1 Tax=Burkholderia theae TaxID=3143496 RepID=UPI003AFB65B9
MEDKDADLWVNLKKTFLEYMRLKGVFVRNPSAVSFVQGAFSVPDERALAIDLVSGYPDAERVIFFKQLVSMASYVNGFTERCRDLILDLPRDWVMKNIEAEVDELLADGDYEEYRCLLELCRKLDRELMVKFARRALDSPDEDVKDVGADFLSS